MRYLLAFSILLSGSVVGTSQAGNIKKVEAATEELDAREEKSVGEYFSEGETTSQLTVEYDKISDEDRVYKKVAKNLNDWSGEYLIGYPKDWDLSLWDGSSEETKLAEGEEFIIKGTTGHGFFSVGELSAKDYEPYHFTIEKMDGGYSIRSASGYYIGSYGNPSALGDLLTSSVPVLNDISLTESGTPLIRSNNNYLFDSIGGAAKYKYYFKAPASSRLTLYKLEEYKLTDATLRFGNVKMSKEAYDENAAYGLLVMSGKKVAEKSDTHLCDVLARTADQSLSGFEDELKSVYGTTPISYDLKPELPTEDSRYYQFGVEFINALENLNIDTALCAATYTVIDDRVYICKETNYSLRSLTMKYIEENQKTPYGEDAKGVLNALVNYNLL